MKNKFQLLFVAVLILSLSVVIALEEIGSDRGSLSVGRQGDICVGSPEECEREQPPQPSTTCGDGFVDTARGEQCDGSNLNGHSCTSLLGSSFSGSLSCQPNCIYNATACTQTTTTPPNNNNGGGGSSGGGGSGGSTIINSAQQSGSGGCIENWECQEWQACVASSQIRLCSDKNNCSTTILKPETKRLCETPALLNNPTTQETTDGTFGRIGALLGAVIGAGANRYSAAIVIGFILFVIAIALVINMVRGKQKKPEVSA